MKLNIFKNNKNSSINIENIIDKDIKNFTEQSNGIVSKTNNSLKTIIEDKSYKGNKLIEVKDLRKSFGDKVVLDGIDIDLYENQNVAILGGNGAGKTTLVEIVVGLNKPTSGEIKYNYKYERNYLEKIGIQFQDSSYPPGLSVKNIIDFIIEMYNCDIPKDDFKGLLKIFGIDQFYNKRASVLSGGQSQRLNALIAIIQKPKILFLDELSTGLDISIRTRIREFIKDYAKNNNMSIVLVSHDMGEIDYLTDRIIFLKNGKKVVDCPKEKIIKEFKTLENFVTKYIHK